MPDGLRKIHCNYIYEILPNGLMVKDHYKFSQQEELHACAANNHETATDIIHSIWITSIVLSSLTLHVIYSFNTLNYCI